MGAKVKTTLFRDGGTDDNDVDEHWPWRRFAGSIREISLDFRRRVKITHTHRHTHIYNIFNMYL